MLQPPPLSQIPRYPVTAGLAIAAIVVTCLGWAGKNIDPFIMTGEVWSHLQLWRAITSTLPHVNFFHLAFNLYWLWVFGTLLEDVFGHARYGAIVAVLAFGSMLAEFVFLHGGVGLSGVGYGMFGMLWALQRYNSRFIDVIDRRTIQTFVVWFFICIALTVTKVMLVANIAHGAGAILGALLGFIACHTGSERARGAIALFAILVCLVVGSTVLWPVVNLTTEPCYVMERAGIDALYAKDYSSGLRFLQRCVQLKGAPASAWYNLGVAYERLGDFQSAAVAFDHAANMPDATPNMLAAAAGTRTPGAAAQEESTNQVPSRSGSSR